MKEWFSSLPFEERACVLHIVDSDLAFLVKKASSSHPSLPNWLIHSFQMFTRLSDDGDGLFFNVGEDLSQEVSRHFDLLSSCSSSSEV